MDLISIIIPTYNRFNFLLNTIKSVKNQSYKDIEIIVINDCSSDERYYNYDWDNENIIMIHLKINSKKKFGYPCAGYVRNKGIKKSKGKYIAFCDDDDIWLPNKLKLQIVAMKSTKCNISCTEGLIGNGIYNKDKTYKKYLNEFYFDIHKNIYKRRGLNLINYPNIINFNLLKIHNIIVCSSVIINRNIFNKIGYFKCIKNGHEDYDYWLRCLLFTNCVLIKDICFYYDNSHGDGRMY